MTKGVRDLRECQIGFQTPTPPGAGWDTPVVPTRRLLGTCGMKKLVNRVFPTEATGLMSSHILNRYYDPWVMAELPVAMGTEGLTYHQMHWYLEMGAVAVAAPVAGVWTYTPALTTADMPTPATIYYGDNAGSWASSSCFARELVISGAFQGPWNMEADIIGRDMETEALLDIAYPTPNELGVGQVETILGQMTILNTHPSCTFAAATPVPGILIDWRVTIPGFHPKFFQDGALYYSLPGLASRHLTLEATIEWDSAYSLVEHTNWAASHMAATPSAARYLQLVATGSAPALPPPAAYAATINMVVMYESFETLEERDGNDIVKYTAVTVYDDACKAAGIPEWQIIVANDELALP